MTAHDDAAKAAAEAMMRHHLLGADEEHPHPWCVCGASWADITDHDDELTRAAEEHFAEAAVTAAAPHLLAPVEAEVRSAVVALVRDYGRVNGYVGRDGQDYVPLRGLANHILEPVRLALPPEPSPDEAVAAERRRIAAAIRAAGHPDGYHRANTSREWAGIYCADCAVTERSARIAEGETSTIRDADPGNAQDARREGESLRAEVERLRLLTSAEMVFVSSAELTAERNAAQERIAAALALHQPEGYFTPDGLADDCPTCDVLHPCATYRALTDAGDDATGTGEAS